MSSPRLRIAPVKREFQKELPWLKDLEKKEREYLLRMTSSPKWFEIMLERVKDAEAGYISEKDISTADAIAHYWRKCLGFPEWLRERIAREYAKHPAKGGRPKLYSAENRTRDIIAFAAVRLLEDYCSPNEAARRVGDLVHLSRQAVLKACKREKARQRVIHRFSTAE